MADTLIPQQTPQQAQAAFSVGGQQPAASSPTTPAPQPTSPAFPTTNTQTQSPVNSTTPTQPTTQINISNGQTPTDTTQQGQSTTAPPVTSLQPGAQGQDVQQLQQYLAQMGYLDPSQITPESGGLGSYGPKTTAAVALMQKGLGLNAASGTGNYGPQTQQALAQKYQGLFGAVKNTTTPDTGAAARAAIGGALDQTSDSSNNPVFSALTTAMQPIMQSLTQVLNNVNNPALTAVSLQTEYNTLRDQYGLPAMNAQLMNMTNIMNGTVGDIRTEITSAGGLATESQVQGMASARNLTIQKQYNALSTQYNAAQQNVQAMMQYATTDQSQALQRSQLSASITESMASISSQMVNMGMTMQNNAKEAVQYNVTQMGYQGLVDSAKGNPQMLGYYENMLALAPGTLSNPDAVAGMDTYKNQQLQINNYKAAISAYNAGYGGGMNGLSNSNAPGAQPVGQIGVNPVDPTTLIRPPSVANGVPLSMTADQMEQYMSTQKSSSVDPGTNNVVAPGVGYYKQQSDGSYVLNSALPSDTDTQYNAIKQQIANAPQQQMSPTVTRKWSLTANAAISNFKNTGTYQVISNVAPYLANIRAAAANPGDKSVSDLELLDSYIRLSKGGVGQITGDQVDILLKGSSLGDKASVLQQKLNTGGSLSDAQRQALIDLSSSVYQENSADYKKIYVQAVQNMQNQSIPTQFWGNLPDFTSLMQQ